MAEFFRIGEKRYIFRYKPVFQGRENIIHVDVLKDISYYLF